MCTAPLSHVKFGKLQSPVHNKTKYVTVYTVHIRMCGVDGGGWGWDLDCILSNSILPIFQVTYRAVCGSEVIVSVSVVHLEWGPKLVEKGGGGG